MKKNINVLFLTVILFAPATSFANKCLMNIGSVGASFDSVVYEGKGSGGQADLASTAAYGLKADWIIYCPDNGWEISPYFRYRNYTFDDKVNYSYFNEVPDSINLFSIGTELKIPVMIRERHFEVPIDIEVREEMGFESATSGGVKKMNYVNIKAMGGLRSFLWRVKGHDITGVLKLGALASLSDKAGMGIIYGLSTEYFLKIWETTSIKFDLYYDSYDQDFITFDMTRTELGLRANATFMF